MTTHRVARTFAWASLVAVSIGISPAHGGTPSNGGVRSMSEDVPNKLRVLVAGIELPVQLPRQVAVDQAVEQPDAATISLRGRAAARLVPTFDLGDDLQVTARAPSGDQPIFKGEIVGIEPQQSPSGACVIVRAFNRQHRLQEGRKTRTFVEVTDADIVERIAREHELEPLAVGDLAQRYDVVVQTQQTDWEFLRERAAHIGYEVSVDGSTLVFRPHEDQPPIVLARRPEGGDARLRQFLARLSSAASVQQVEVRGWDPPRQQRFVGTATAPTILLVPPESDPDQVPPFGRLVEIEEEVPLTSAEHAAAVAWATLEQLTADRTSGEAASRGHAKLRAGIVVTIDGVDPRFDGRYFVQAASHRFRHASECGGGYCTLLRLRREDRGMFRIPQIDDEVLVTFAHGDFRQPIVVGSLFDEPGPCTRDRSEDND